jgi:class 3 adenylate cyclase
MDILSSIDSTLLASRLRFPGKLEQLFHEDYYQKSIKTCQVALALALALYAGFGVLDAWSAPLSKHTIWFIRYAVICPLTGATLIWTFFRSFKKRMQLILSLLVFAAGLGIILMIALSHKEEAGRATYYAGLMLVSMWAYTFVRLRFVNATIVNWLMVAGYEIVVIFWQNGLATPLGRVTFTSNNFFFITTNIIGMFASYFLEVYHRRDFLQRRIIEIEQDKIQGLLFNILPKEIAAILKTHRRVIADRFDNVSILFADVVDFTPMSARMTPEESVNVLNEVFSDFDVLVEKYGLEKIKTIGDCYMVAAGIPTPRPDHAHAIVRLALEMRDYVSQRKFQGRTLSFRVGINSGAVVAGVIGRKKFAYDLWGDTVNTASRMESHGKGGKIQISYPTYELIKDDFACESGGTITVKGKGPTDVWYVVKETTQPAQALHQLRR